MRFYQAAQNGQILDVFSHVFAFGRLQQHRESPKAGIIQYHAKGLKPQITLPDVLVPVHVTVQVLPGVVQVESFQAG